MGQSLSRRPAAASTPTTPSAPVPDYANDTDKSRRSLPRRIFSSLPKPSLRSRPALSSLALPNEPEQTLKAKKRRWGLSRRRNAPANAEATIPERMDPLVEYDEHQVDRDVDEFGIITHRVPDSHSDSRAPSAKGKEKAKDVGDIEDVGEDNDTPISSSSATFHPPARVDHIDDDQVVISPSIPPDRLPPLPTVQELERPPPPASPLPTLPSMPHSSVQPMNPNSRPFPPPGTLVVVQGVVHTTDVSRSSERPVATSNPTPPITNDSLGPNLETNPSRPSSLPPGARLRNPLSGIMPRPTSMVPSVPSSPPLEPMIESSTADPLGPQAIFNDSGATDGGEDEDRAHPHGISMAQGPIGGSGLSASSIDVLGTLLSVAAAATAASLLTGSSEPIFSSGLTSSQPPPSSGSIPQSPALNPNTPSERPLSPTPTSDAGRMRHVWSSLRDRLGLGSGANNSQHSSDTTSGSGPGQTTSLPPSDIVRPRDPRELMLAEMARAFNLGLGLGGATSGTPSAVTSHTPEGAMPEAGDVPAGEMDREQPSLPPPDSFERFLMDLQTDLRVTLMQEQDLDVRRGVPQDIDETVEDPDEDQPIPELQSLSDSDSEEFETRHLISGEDEPDRDEDLDVDVDEDMHTAQELLSGRTSPAVSALGASLDSPFGVKTPAGTASSHTSGMSLPHEALLQSTSTAVSSSADAENDTCHLVTDNDKCGDMHAVHASSGVAVGTGSHVPVDDSGPTPSEMRPEVGLDGLGEGAVMGVAHSPASTRGRRVEAEGGRAVSGVIAMSPHDTQDPSNVPDFGIAQDSCLPGTSSLSVPLAFNNPNSAGSISTQQGPSLPSTSALVPSESESTTQTSSSAIPNPADSPMPFRFPFTSSSASRTEHTPGGGINWWRMYRFPAVASANVGQQGGPQGSLPSSQLPLRTPSHGPSHSSPWSRTTDQNRSDEAITPRGVAGVHTGLAAPALTRSASPANMPELVSSNPSASAALPADDQVPDPSINTSTNSAEHRNNVVVPVIVVGLQSVNMDRQPPHVPHSLANPAPAMDEEEGEGIDFDGLEQSMTMPLHIPEPAEFRHHNSSSPSTTQQDQGNQQPPRGRTWQSRAANAIRNLRPSRRNADATSPQPQETPGSRTFLIYVIGGYYPPDHQIITGGNLDSFEALWELAELLGQVKPPTVSKEEIERSGLEIIKASTLKEYEEQGRIASNCIDRCLICLDDYDPEDELRVLTCKHAFHQGCVDRWLETGRNNCPACRTKGVANQDA